jgi:hypothetical protein
MSPFVQSHTRFHPSGLGVKWDYCGEAPKVQQAELLTYIEDEEVEGAPRGRRPLPE